MNREFDNGFEQEEQRVRGRSRRREAAGTERLSSRRPAYASGQETRVHTFTPAYSQARQARGEHAAGTERDTAFRRGSSGADHGHRGRNTDPSHQKKKRKMRTIITLVIAELIALILIAGCWFVKRGFSSMQIDTDFKKEDMTNPYISVDKEQTMKGYWTIALFGVDSRNNSVGKGNNADVIILCNINQETYEIKLVSIYRDTYLNVDDKGSYNKINQSYFTGGPKQAIAALNRNLDLEIDDYATFNWKAVADAINILGGVDVELSKAEFYYINAYITETVKATGVGSYQLKHAGMNHLDGVQAVAYARLRKMDTDFARTERQRKIIELCFDKMKQANFSVVNNVMEVVFPQIMTSVTLNDVIPAAMNVAKYTIADTMGFPEARTGLKMGRKGDCVIPQTLESNVIALHQFLFDDEDYVPSDMVKKISNKISADTGMYKEGTPVESVGTDGGYIPKATTAAPTEESSSLSESESASESSLSETDESIIDGEYPWDLETDENGYPIDPPEDFDYGTGRYPGYPGYPGGETVPSGTLSPTKPGSVKPGMTTGAEESTGALKPGSEGPGSEGPGNETSSGPGIVPIRPDESSAESGPGAGGPGKENGTTGTTAPYPGAPTEAEEGGPGSVIIGPGVS